MIPIIMCLIICATALTISVVLRGATLADRARDERIAAAEAKVQGLTMALAEYPEAEALLGRLDSLTKALVEATDLLDHEARLRSGAIAALESAIVRAREDFTKALEERHKEATEYTADCIRNVERNYRREIAERGSPAGVAELVESHPAMVENINNIVAGLKALEERVRKLDLVRTGKDVFALPTRKQKQEEAE